MTRLQPERSQYTQYNVPLCSLLPALLTSAAGALPAWRTTITTKTHPKKQHAVPQSYTVTQARHGGKKKTAPARLTRHGAANMKLDKVGKQTAGWGGAQTLSLYFLSFPSPLLHWPFLT